MLFLTDDITIREIEKKYLVAFLSFWTSPFLSLLQSFKMPPTTATEQSSRPDLHVENVSEINLKERWVILLLDKIIIY